MLMNIPSPATPNYAPAYFQQQHQEDVLKYGTEIIPDKKMLKDIANVLKHGTEAIIITEKKINKDLAYVQKTEAIIIIENKTIKGMA